MSHPPEQWRPVAGYEGLYEVSNLGRIRSLKYGKLRILKQQGQSRSMLYRCVRLYGARNPKTGRLWTIHSVHRLVLFAFIGPRPPTVHTNHIDGDPTNNHLSNLEYVTPKQNLEHASRVLWAKNGKPNVKRKLTAEQVRELRRLAKGGMTLRVLGSMFGISNRQASGIVRREYYKWVT